MYEYNEDQEEEIMARAFAAYYQYLRKGGYSETQPSNTSCVQDYNGKHYAVLENVNGVLAVYRIKNDGYLKKLQRWPKELEKSK